MDYKIRVIIPAFNEENAVGKVIDEIPREIVKEIIVVDNNSTDKTFKVAEEKGVTALKEIQKGYGFACLKGMAHISAQHDDETDIIVFLDGDYSDYPEEMSNLVASIVNENCDLVIGSRALGEKESGAMTPQQIFGNWLATRLIKLFYGVKYTDLGPFRAVKYESLKKINMVDTTYGWTVEMQLKAAKLKMNVKEVPVNYRVRVGKSKISGTLKGTLMAGYKIIWTIFKHL